jgi:hypothetical protein
LNFSIAIDVHASRHKNIEICIKNCVFFLFH